MENIKTVGSNVANLNVLPVKNAGVETNEASGVAETGVDTPQATADFKLEINDLLRQKLAEASKTVQERMNLLKSLPPEIAEAVRVILQESAGKGESLSNGLADVFRSQKITADTLNDFAEVLLTAAKLTESGEEGKVAADKLLAQFSTLRQAEKTELFRSDTVSTFFSNQTNDSTQVEKMIKGSVNEKSMPDVSRQEAGTLQDKQIIMQKVAGGGTAEKFSAQLQEKAVSTKQDAVLLTPQRLAGELLQLARNATDSSQGAQLQKLVDVFQKQGAVDEHPYAAKLGEALTSLEPRELSFVAARHELPALKEAWTKLAAAEALPFLDLSKDEMETAVLVLREIEKTVKQNNLKGVLPEATKQLTDLLEQLPPEVTEKLASGLQQGQVQEKIARLETALDFAKTFKETPLLKADGTQVRLPELKEILTGMVTQDKAMELSEFVKTVKQVALREVAGEQLKEGLTFLESRLGLKEVEKNPLWNALQKNEELNKGAQNTSDSLLKANNPLLAKVVLLLRATEAAEWRGHSAADLRQAAAAIKEIAAVMQKQDSVSGERQSEHSVLSFSTALQMGPGVTYPAHIHIYHQHAKEKGRNSAKEYETWVRVSLETENIGDVRVVFRIYENDRLDVRVGFRQVEALQQFRKQLPELRMSLEGERLKLHDLGGNKI